MFDNLIRELRRLERTPLSVSVPLEADEEGYLDRECPSPECKFEFKVLGEDWTTKVRDEEVFCPRCGHAASADQWHTKAQIERLKRTAVAALDRLKDCGAVDIRFACLLAAPEGISNLQGHHPDVKIWTCSVEDHLNDHGYIVPGLGDAGDRMFGTK